MAQIILLKITELFNTISWSYVGSVLFGALVAALATHYAAKRREREKLKYDIKIKVADELVSTIGNLHNEIIKYKGVLSQIVNQINHYNTCLQDLNAVKCLGESKTNIFDEFVKAYESYKNIDTSFFNKVDIRRIILWEFWGMRNFMFDHNMDMLKNYYLKLYSILYGINISIRVGSSVDSNKISELDSLIKEYDNKLLDMLCYLDDFQIGLQNEFLSKLFKKSIPIRVAAPEYKVLVVGMKYDCMWNKKF